MLAFSCRVPSGWQITPIPPDEYDFENPAVFVPLLVAMAPYGAVLLTVAARPGFGDGTVQDWAEFLCSQNNLTIHEMREARIGRMPCVLCEASTDSEMGVMRSRSLFLEDGGRLFNIQALAPREIWPSVEATFSQLLGSFVPDQIHGITATLLREMIAGDRVEFAFVDDTPVAPAPEPAKAKKEVEVWSYAEDPPPVVEDESAAAQAPDEFAGQPDWWRDAVLLERAGRLDEAEQTIRKALDHIGVYSQIAYMYELRVARLREEGDVTQANASKERAIHWLHAYAGSATSGGEGAALSRERDERIAALNRAG